VARDGSRIEAVNIPRELFANRRQRFLTAIPDGVAVLPSAPVSVRSNDVEFIYRQDNDFYYLTGFAEPESVAVFAPGNAGGQFILFVRPRDRERETWTGKRAGVEGAVADFGADRAYHIDELDHVLPEILAHVEKIYYPLGNNEPMNQRMVGWLRQCQAMRPRSGAGANSLLDPREILHEMRLFKEPEELAVMRRAIAISNLAHQRAMREARGGKGEWTVEAAIEYAFRSEGAAGPSYPSIVASGPNATILHYINNDREMRRGELLLIDAGCEYDFYASDITRTFPIGARFTPVQRDLYQLVLDSQLKGIEIVRPGISIDEVHEVALKVLVEGMRSLKMLEGSADEIIAKATYRRFYMHRTSHWLGMDVHDVGNYRKEGKPRLLEPGMVLTCEPGIYIAPDDQEAPAEMRGIGIRIEDDVLVTAEGYEVLSAAVPKQIPEIEALTTA
jgi:Xaa-Pro aminopeptidase